MTQGGSFNPAADLHAVMTLDALPQDGTQYVVRLLETRDAADVHRLANDWEVVRMLSNLPFPYPRGLADDWIASTQLQAKAGTAWHFAIERDGRLVGCIGLTYEKLRRAARIGYWVGRAHWGQGIAKYAVMRVSDWALAQLHITKVYADVSVDNAASIAVLTRLGFRHVGTDTRHLVARGGSQPVNIYERTSACESLQMTSGKKLSQIPLVPYQADGSRSKPEEKSGKPILLVVAVALIDDRNRVLLATRPEGKTLAGLWEFPGGKIESGETPEAALQRELKEELDIVIDPSCLAPFAFTSRDLGPRHLLMPLYLCRKWYGMPTPQEGQRLAWVSMHELAQYPMPEADAPLVSMLQTLL